MEDLIHELKALTTEARQLAGGLCDVSLRAGVYHHLYHASGANHVFPLIAAHGALWSAGYFRFGMRLGRVLAWQYVASSNVRRSRLAQLEAFANAFREINREVCIDSYVNFHLTDRFGEHSQVTRFVEPDHLSALLRLHCANRACRMLNDQEKRAIFQTHFLREQKLVVGPAIEKAIDQFDWPIMRFLALRPTIRFAYFPTNRCLRFTDFSSREQRIQCGLQAFDLAAEVGWQVTENSLRKYKQLPTPMLTEDVRPYQPGGRNIHAGGVSPMALT